MEEKKIATSVDILINVDRFEHFQITKYAEKKITYSTHDEMIQKEDQLTRELISDIRRSLNISCEDFGGISKDISQKMEAVKKIENKIGNKMPTWLEEGSDPNIANTAKKNAVFLWLEAHADNEDLKEKKKISEAETDDFLNGHSESKDIFNDKSNADNSCKIEEKYMDADLFGDDEDLFK